MKNIFVTGTDTDIGKTIASAWLVIHKNASYFKPIQSGNVDGTDSNTIKNICEIDETKIINPIYETVTPLSPDQSAKIDGIEINIDKIFLPKNESNTVVEGAGGLFVPINDNFFVIDVIKKMNIETVIVAKTGLGTINHTLLTYNTLKNYGINILGIIFIGDKNERNMDYILKYTGVKMLCHIPILENVNKKNLLNILPNTEL